MRLGSGFFWWCYTYIELQRISERSNILGDQYQKKQRHYSCWRPDIPSCKHTSHKRFGVLDFMMKFQNAAMLHYNPLSLTWPFLNLRSRSTAQFFLTCCLFNKVITRTNRESNTHDVLVQWEFVFKQASSWCHYSDITRPRVHPTKRSHDKVSTQ